LAAQGRQQPRVDAVTCDLEHAPLAAGRVDGCVHVRAPGLRDVDDGWLIVHGPQALLRGCSHLGSSVYGSMLSSRSQATPLSSSSFCSLPLRHASNRSVAPPRCSPPTY